MGFINNPRIVTDGLVLHLDAANMKSFPGSGTTWSDLSGQANDGTLTNGPTYSSDNLGSFSFDGTNDYISGVINGFNPDTSCTLETFVRRPTTPPSWRTYFNIKPNSSSNFPFFEFRTIGANFDTAANYYNGVDYATTTYTINNTNFYHLVTAYDGVGNIHLYVNGSFHNTKTSVPAFGIGANPRITIGRAYSENRPTNIEMSVCRVYNRVLSPEEVKQNFDALRGRFGI